MRAAKHAYAPGTTVEVLLPGDELRLWRHALFEGEVPENGGFRVSLFRDDVDANDDDGGGGGGGGSSGSSRSLDEAVGLWDTFTALPLQVRPVAELRVGDIADARFEGGQVIERVAARCRSERVSVRKCEACARGSE